MKKRSKKETVRVLCMQCRYSSPQPSTSSQPSTSLQTSTFPKAMPSESPAIRPEIVRRVEIGYISVQNDLLFELETLHPLCFQYQMDIDISIVCTWYKKRLMFSRQRVIEYCKTFTAPDCISDINAQNAWLVLASLISEHEPFYETFHIDREIMIHNNMIRHRSSVRRIEYVFVMSND